MKCNNCDSEAINKKGGLCGACKAKEYRKRKPEVAIAYRERTKERREKKRLVYYKKNKERLLSNAKKSLQEKGYPYERNEKRKKASALRAQTAKKYPLDNQKCIKCSNKAEHRHHTTEPMHIDKFLFLCERCHNIIHGRTNFKKAVLVV